MTSDDVRDRGEEAYGLPVSLVGWHSEDTVGEMDSSPTSSADRTGPLTILNRYSRARVLELALLLSVIVSVICSALWLSRIFTPSMSLHRTDTISLTAAQTTKVSTGQPSAQASSIVTVLPSAQNTPIPATQLAVPDKSTPAAQSPSLVPTTPVSYEAESPQNTLTGGARIIGCKGGVCSGGARVGDIGLNAGTVGTLQFNNINKESGGQYTLTIYYLIAGSDKLAMYISVNGWAAVVLNVADTANGDTVGTASITINLNAGNNTIEFSNPSNPAPDIDRIVV